MAISTHLQVTDAQFSRAINQLKEFVAIPSVSNTENADFSMPNLEKAAIFAGKSLKDLGFEVEYFRVDNCAPFVIAQKAINKDLPTILLYAHYDIQPVERDKWLTDPFIVTERDGRLYGRGASDDKGGIIAILTTLNMYKEAGRELPVNIKILFEGEEEYGSSHIAPMLKQTGDKLDAHALVVLDGMNKGVDFGTLSSSTRGVGSLNVEIKALEKPIHSGMGCLAPDPAMALAVLVSSLKNPREIPGFMNGFNPMSDQEKQIYDQTSITAEEYAKEQGIVPHAALRGNPNQSINQRIVEEPSLSILNMTSGKPNGGNSIQDAARCTIGIRPMAGQDPDAVAQAVKTHLLWQPLLNDLKVTITAEEGAWAWKADVSKGYSKLYLEALAQNFPKAVAMPCGGALPLLREFELQFPKMEMIVSAVEDPATAAHSHNESQDINVFRRAINSLATFLDKAAQLK